MSLKKYIPFDKTNQTVLQTKHTSHSWQVRNLHSRTMQAKTKPLKLLRSCLRNVKKDLKCQPELKIQQIQTAFVGWAR